MGREHWALQQLTGLPFVPALIDYRCGHEHRYLAREFVEGEPLIDMLHARHPVRVLGPEDPAHAPTYGTGRSTSSTRSSRRPGRLHECGVVFGDLHPGNILVRPAAGSSFIDMETPTPVDDGRTQSWAPSASTRPGRFRSPTSTFMRWRSLRLSDVHPAPADRALGGRQGPAADRVGRTRTSIFPPRRRRLNAPSRTLLARRTDHSVPWRSRPGGSASDTSPRASWTSPRRSATTGLYPGDAGSSSPPAAA